MIQNGQAILSGSYRAKADFLAESTLAVLGWEEGRLAVQIVTFAKLKKVPKIVPSARFTVF